MHIQDFIIIIQLHTQIMNQLVIFIIYGIKFFPLFIQVDSGDPRIFHDKTQGKKLLDAAYQGNLESVTKLIENGTDVNIRGQNGETALFLASGSSAIDVVEYLIQNGAMVNAKTKNGNTALMWASYNGHTPSMSNKK